MTDWQFYWWQAKARLFHVFGRHAWVARENWSHVEEHGLIEVDGYTCWFCPAERGL